MIIFNTFVLLLKYNTIKSKIIQVKSLYLYISLLFISYNTYAKVYPDLRTILNSQIKNSVINIPKGTYTLDLTSGKYSFEKLNNVVINGNGSTIICNRQSQAFQFLECTNVVFSNLFIEYDPPCSTQGTITKMSSDMRTWDVAIHDGYPIDNLGASRIQIYGQNTLELVPNFGSTSSNNLTRTGDRTVSFTINGFQNNYNVKVGDYVVLDVLATGTTQPHTLFMSGCKNMELDSITIYDSNCFSFLEVDCERTHFNRCIVTRKPFDSKYKIQRLRAGIADGIHSANAKVGPIIEQCRVEYNGDDCIALNGTFYPIYNVDESGKYIYFLSNYPQFNNIRIKTGDSLVCVNNDGSIRGNFAGTLVNNTLETPTSAQMSACIAKFNSVSNSGNYIYGIKVHVDNWVPGVAIGDLIYSKNRICSGFKIINNSVGHTRSRGILVKGSDGIIDGNTIVGSEGSAIVITPQFFWMEAGFSNNVEISNNKISNCMFRANSNSTEQAGTLSIVYKNPNNNFAPTGSLNNISIHNNIIEECPQPCVVLSSIKGVKYYQNSISPSLTIIRTFGADLGVQNNNDLWMINVTDFSITNPISIINLMDLQESKNNLKNEIYIDNNSNIVFSDIKQGESAQLSICDMLGRRIYSTKLIDSKKISTAFLGKGIYVVSVKYNQYLFGKKIIIL